MKTTTTIAATLALLPSMLWSAEQAAVGGVDHVGLSVSDLSASEAFFTSVLQFTADGRNEDYPAVFLTNGTLTVTLWQTGADPRPFDRKRNVGLHHLALQVADFAQLDALHEQAKAHPGVRVEFAPEAFYGGPARHMMLREPSGNRIELIHRPPPESPLMDGGS